MKLLCFGDLHLGQGSHLPGRLDDQRAVLGRIAGLAVERGVDGILFAGDAFEGPAVPPEQLQVFAQFVEACRLAGIPILAITGNGKHDAAVRDTNGLAIFEHIDGITICSQPDVHEFAGCAVAVLPWVHPGRLIARAGRDVPRDEVNALAAELLVDVARGLLEDCEKIGAPSILLGHWSVSGTALPAGLPVDQLREPVLSASALEELGYDALVFGHIHRCQPIGEHGFYTGSPMPLNHGEAHVGHGVYIVELGADVFEDVEWEFVPIDSPRFVTAGLAIDDIHGSSIDCDEGVTDAFVRVQFTATDEQMRRVDIASVRRSLIEAGARYVKVEPSIVRADRARAQGVDEQLDETAALEAWMQAQDVVDELRDLLRGKARDYLEVVA